MSSAILKVEGLTLVSDEGIIVDQLSFHVNTGEIVALTGKSGSGKTSIALSILGILPAGIRQQEGDIRFCSGLQQEMILPADSNSWHHLRGTHIGYTQQDAYGAFDPVLTMKEQMMMIIRERIKRKDIGLEHELRAKLEEAGLEEIDRLFSSYPHQLSGGQLQRCQIAMVLVIRPELLIADEPTSAIDKINQLELLDLLSVLRKKYQMAILVITHEEAVIRHLADREIRLNAVTQDFILPVPSDKVTGADQGIPVIQARGLTYTHSFGGMMYNTGATIGSLDFDLHRGLCLGIVGESGSGKSTLAQLLVGLYKPLHGNIILDGKDVDFSKHSDVVHLRNKVQLVMQDGRGSLHPYLTIGQILSEISKIGHSNLPAGSVALADRLSEVGLPESILDRRASQLSGGECLRVSIARALIVKPEVLICDESTSALDGASRDSIIELLVHLMHQRGLAIIFISHDERIIRSLADQVMVLADGKVVEQGPAAQVIRYPTHPVTKRIFTLRAALEERKSI